MALIKKANRFLTAIIAIAFFCMVTLYFSDPPTNADDGRPYDFSVLNATKPVPPLINVNRSDDPLTWGSLFVPPGEYKDIVETFHYLNYHHEILNEDRFGSVKKSKYVVIIQVHQRIEYLKHLIATLKAAKGIENTLLVFSHDVISEPINELIRKIDFSRVIQIFYPYSIQIFANTFPGTDPNVDCPASITVDKAAALRCLNWQFPDKYGHYRLAGLTQIKHHWWWKMNYLDGIMKRYSLDTHVMLLEEDHYVAPDVFHVLDMLIERQPQLCSECKVFSLGAYLKNYNNYRTNINSLSVQYWYASKHNMALIFNTSVWNEIRECAKMFCTFEEYNWDFMMLQISLHCFKEKLRVLTPKSPRVIHVGLCGTHQKHCDSADKIIAATRTLFEQMADVLFPKDMVVTEVAKRMLKPPKPNGGWGDPRDHDLCLMNTYPFKPGTLLPGTLLNYSSILPPFDRSNFNRTLLKDSNETE